MQMLMLMLLIRNIQQKLINNIHTPMIQTIVLTQNGRYPFGEVANKKRVIKVQDVQVYTKIELLKQAKLKMQKIFMGNDKGSQTTISQKQCPSVIKLFKIYQQDLSLHFIYEYVSKSLNMFIQSIIQNQKGFGIVEMNIKLFLKKVSYELGILGNYLTKMKIKTQMQYQLLGVDEQQNIRLFVDANCHLLSFENHLDVSSNYELEKQIQQELRIYYAQKKLTIISRIQAQFQKMKKKQSYVPNFVIKGNKLIFPGRKRSEVIDQNQLSNFTGSNFTQSNCESVDDIDYVIQEDKNIRKTQQNLFSKLKKTQSFNEKNNEFFHSNRRNLVESQEFDESYIQNVNKTKRYENNNERNNSTQESNIFNRKTPQRFQEENWRNSQIPSNLRQTHLPHGTNVKSPNRFAYGKRSHSNRDHKNSFQFNPKKNQKQHFNHNKSFDANSDEENGQKSFHQTKSIRIELQQTTKGNKQRKNSYKVKILTCQQMELDGENVQEFVFGAMNKNFDRDNQNSEHDRQSKKTEEDYDDQKTSNQEQYESNKSQRNNATSRQQKQRYKNIFAEKFKTQQSHQFQPQNFSKYSQSPLKHKKQKQRQKSKEQCNYSSSSMKNIFDKYYQRPSQTKSKNHQLQQKIKLAKQKAQSVLHKYMKTKKYGGKLGSTGH